MASGHYCAYCFLSDRIDDIYTPGFTEREASFYCTLINELIPEGEIINLLEVGCGSGRIIGNVFEKLTGAGRQVEAIGVDICPTMVEIAKRNYHYPELHFDKLDFPEETQGLEKNPFNIVLLIQSVILHRQDIDSLTDLPSRKMLEEIKRLLAPGGLLILDVVRYERWGEGSTRRPLTRGMKFQSGGLTCIFSNGKESIFRETEFEKRRERVRYWRVSANRPGAPFVSPWLLRYIAFPEEIRSWLSEEGYKIRRVRYGYGEEDEGRLVLLVSIS